jgi:hypothetical protein
LLLLVIVACTKAPDRPDPTPPPSPPPTPVPAACELTGEYRVRIGNPAEAYVWHRFTITADGTLADPSPAELASYQLALDRKRCTVVVKHEEGYNAKTITLNVRGTDVTGEEVTSHGTSPSPITGVRGPQQMPDPCFVDGVYELASDAQWDCDPPERSVGTYTPFEVFALRVQAVRGEVVIDRVKERPPFDPMAGDIKLARSGCSVTLAMTHGRRMTATLAFQGDRFDGTVTEMELGGGDSGGPWTCRVANVKLTGKRVR